MKKLIVISALWCPSCLLLKKHLKKISEEFNIDYEILDYDMDEDKVIQYDIGDKLPVIIFNDNKLIGEKTYEEIVAFIKEHDIK